MGLSVMVCRLIFRKVEISTVSGSTLRLSLACWDYDRRGDSGSGRPGERM